MTKPTLCLLLVAVAGQAAEPRPQPEHGRGSWWKASIVAFVAAQAADAGSSYGYREANSLYGSRFDGRGIALKASIAVAVPVVERLILHRHPTWERAATAFNFAAAGATTSAVIYNVRDSVRSTRQPIGIIPGSGSVAPPMD